MTGGSRKSARKASLGLTAAACAVFVAGMVGVSFAAVPLYRIFCALTGYAGTTQQATRAPDATLDRIIKIRFDANIGNGLGWSFRPVERQVRVKVGAVAEVSFVAENRGATRTTATAAFNVTPLEVGAYFNKTACFCFTDQTLGPGEKVILPVVFFVDPSIAEDRNLDVVDTITLSYTFYPADSQPTRPVAAATLGEATGPL